MLRWKQSLPSCNILLPGVALASLSMSEQGQTVELPGTTDETSPPRVSCFNGIQKGRVDALEKTWSVFEGRVRGG